MRVRTRGRELALHFLYQRDVRGPELDAELSAVWEGRKEPAEAVRFARELVEAYLTHRDQVDDEISTVAENWDLQRMAFLDRNVLRIAVVEMTLRTDVPPKVAINEAIEMGKRYGTSRSGAFINGILDRILKSRPEAADASASAGLGEAAAVADPEGASDDPEPAPEPDEEDDVPETA
jgi:N utilization substance protein B